MKDAFIKNIGIMDRAMIDKLESTLIVLFGLGGVGGFTYETFVRVGIKNFIIIDKDKFEITNLNRQLASNLKTIGLNKVDVYKERALNIDENIKILNICENVNFNNIGNIFSKIKNFDNIEQVYIVDCIDDINAKIEIIKKCNNLNYNLISCMGTANHRNTKNIKITKLLKTEYCPLAKKIRNKLKYDKSLNPNVLFIDEEPIDISMNAGEGIHISTIQYVPAICGMKIAEFVIGEIIFNKN